MNEVIEQRGNQILEKHNTLFHKLLKIPDSRKITYREDYLEGLRIGKPRFEPIKFKWTTQLLTDIHDHLQDIWNFFEEFSYWFDDTILILISYHERNLSKKSIIYLLERDLWQTDEIYGDYLIEEEEEHLIISYYRREKKVRTFRIKSSTEEDLKNWICSNARKQIKTQFTILWEMLETEIEVCIKEKYRKISTSKISFEQIVTKFNTSEKLLEISQEAALLSLGWLAEQWILLSLNLENKNIGDRLINQAQLEGLINKNQVKMFINIQRNYNDLKHKTTFSVDRTKLEQLFQQFSAFLQL